MGGAEAALFAEEVLLTLTRTRTLILNPNPNPNPNQVLEMYRRQAKRCGWKFDVISVSEFDTGGCREATACLKGSEVRSTVVRGRLGLGLGLGLPEGARGAQLEAALG